MGRLAKIIGFARKTLRETAHTDVQCNPGGDANITAYHISPAGDDSHPLPNDTAMLVELRRSNSFASAGYIDPKNAQTALAGEKRTYSRNGSGDEVASIWLKNDGTIVSTNGTATVTQQPDGTTIINNKNGTATQRPNGAFRIENGSGYLELTSGGSVDINGLIISTGGNATSAGGISLEGHTHSQGADSDGNSQVDTNPPS